MISTDIQLSVYDATYGNFIVRTLKQALVIAGNAERCVVIDANDFGAGGTIDVVKTFLTRTLCMFRSRKIVLLNADGLHRNFYLQLRHLLYSDTFSVVIVSKNLKLCDGENTHVQCYHQISATRTITIGDTTQLVINNWE